VPRRENLLSFYCFLYRAFAILLNFIGIALFNHITLLNFNYVLQLAFPDSYRDGKFTIYQPIILYRKFSAHNIFTGQAMLPQGNVLITDASGVVKEITALKDAGDGIEFFDGLLCPGFVNAHCHLELSHLKGLIPEKTGLVDFVFKIITERHLAYRQAGFAEEEILAAIETAENEMLQNGIVAVGDICNNTLTIPQKKKQRLQYHNFIEVSGFVPALAQDRFDKASSILAAYQSLEKNDRRASFGQHSMFNVQCSTLSPHAPYSVSPQLFELINSATENNIVTIHNQETFAEDDFIKNKTGDFLRLYQKMGIDISFYEPSGKSSLQTWLPYFNKNQSIILVHNVTTQAGDIAFAKLPIAGCLLPIFFCLCPNANLYITNTLPNVNMLMEQDCNIILGTDSLASNHQLNILEEIKTLHKNFPAIELQTMLQWATINGAKALQMENVLGSFEKNKKPGVVLIEGVENLQINKNSTSKRVL
jgi:aminodeoxyfutalosine deaminase